MTLSTIDAQLLVLEPSSSASVADFVVPKEDIESVTAKEMAGREVAQGKIQINNSTKAYTVGSKRIDYDDLIEFRIAWEGADLGGAAGEDPAGERAAGGTAFQLGSTLIVTDWNVTGQEWSSTLHLDVENFVFNRLRESPPVRHRETDLQISGSSDAHLNTILADHVPDVDTSQLPTITETIDYSADGKRAHKVVDELAQLAHDATGDSWIVGADKKALTMQKVGDLSSQWTADDGQTDFKGSFEHSAAPDSLVNDIRVEGGIDPENVDDSQTTHDAFTTVTSSTRLTTRVDSRKSELPRVQIYAKPVSNSDDDLRVRLQNDDGAGNPVDVSDTDSDLASKRQPVEEEGWIDFRMGDHILAPREQPHLIIEANGSDGVQVGQDSGTNEPAFKVHFSKPVIVRIPSNASQAQYRVHGDEKEDESLETFSSARDRARAELDRHAFPKLEFGPTSAESRRAHELSIADVVTLDYDWLRAEGDYITTAVSHAYQSSTLKTEISLKSVVQFA